jgi:hypothetical protein
VILGALRRYFIGIQIIDVNACSITDASSSRKRPLGTMTHYQFDGSIHPPKNVLMGMMSVCDAPPSYAVVVSDERRMGISGWHFNSASDDIRMLDEEGLPWTAIALMVGTSVDTIASYVLTGEGDTSYDVREGSYRAASFYQSLLSLDGVDSAAEWLMRPVDARIPVVTPLFLYSTGHKSEVIKYGKNEISNDELLSIFDSNWMNRIDDDFMVIRASDGNLSIGHKR